MLKRSDLLQHFWVCGADVTFDSKGMKYVCDYAGEGLTLTDAVKQCANLHPAFGLRIYKVECKTKQGLLRHYGLLSGNTCSGHRVVEEFLANEHPDWRLYRPPVDPYQTFSS